MAQMFAAWFSRAISLPYTQVFEVFFLFLAGDPGVDEDFTLGCKEGGGGGGGGADIVISECIFNIIDSLPRGQPRSMYFTLPVGRKETLRCISWAQWIYNANDCLHDLYHSLYWLYT
jgi:hypothetical protein